MAKRYWLVKQEPEAYAWEVFVKDGRADWTGVRNYQARNNLRAMSLGDRVLYYHSVTGKAVMGVAEVVREHFPDPTAEAGDWSAVDLAPLFSLPKPVTLEAIKADPALTDLPLIKQSRLSVMPVDRKAFEHLVRMGGARP